MDRCPSCDAERGPNDAPCVRCGAFAPTRPSLELELRPRPRAPAPVADDAQASHGGESAIDLAFDPRERQSADRLRPMALARNVRAKAELGRSDDADLDASDAWLLADYGEPPRHWLLSPMYAWRVVLRRRAIKRALMLRKGEAARAATSLEDALVALAERVRPAAARSSDYADAFETLARAERVLRSRDEVLTSAHDEQAARLASLDARLIKLESELAAARVDGREAATALVSLQAIFVREESNLKRAETELRSSQTRASTGTRE